MSLSFCVYICFCMQTIVVCFLTCLRLNCRHDTPFPLNTPSCMLFKEQRYFDIISSIIMQKLTLIQYYYLIMSLYLYFIHCSVISFITITTKILDHGLYPVEKLLQLSLMQVIPQSSFVIHGIEFLKSKCQLLCIMSFNLNL